MSQASAKSQVKAADWRLKFRGGNVVFFRLAQSVAKSNRQVLQR